MMKIFRLIVFICCFSVLSLQARAEGLAVLELFTTGGCPNCPPADAVLANIARDNPENVILLGCHVTFMDREFYTDPFSLVACDARHKAYLSSLPLPRLFTPQLVINGKFDTQGHVEQTVRAGMKMAQSINSISPIQLSINGAHLDISLPKIRTGKALDVWLFSYDRVHMVDLPTGQNTNMKIEYVNAVRNVEKLLHWDGSYRNMSYPLSALAGEAYAVIAQYEDHTEIVAAGKVEKN